MNKKIKTRDYFHNRSVIVDYNGVEYPGTFTIAKEDLVLKIDRIEDVEIWRKSKEDIDCLKATILDNREKITCLNCMSAKHSAYTEDGKTVYSTSYHVDRIIVGYHLDKIDSSVVNSIDTSYEDISWFTKHSFYNQKILEDKVEMNPFYKEYILKDKSIIFHMLPSYNGNDNQITISTTRGFTVNFKERKTIKESIYYMYFIKNFLMILGKRDIRITEQSIYIDGVECELIDGYIESYEKIVKDSLLFHLNNRNPFQIESLTNLEEVIETFEIEYERLTPLLELYYNVVKYKIPSLTRFVNSITMLEYFSREYDNDKALERTQNKPRKKSKKEPEFIDRVYSLIENVNDHYNLEEEEMEKISKNIKDARTYYIHYEPIGKKLKEQDLFGYTHFIEDTILLNIYQIIGIDLNHLENISYVGFFYDLEDIIK